MTLFSRHLDPAALGLAVLGDGADPRTDAHLASCARCRRERDRIALLLAEAAPAPMPPSTPRSAPPTSSASGTPSMQRIARNGGAGPGAALPHGPDERPLAAPRADARWLVAAAAAGLLLGVAAGQLPHLLRTGAGDARRGPQPWRPPRPAPAADWRLDDSLLSEVDAALASVTRPELEALDALTPVHYETR